MNVRPNQGIELRGVPVCDVLCKPGEQEDRQESDHQTQYRRLQSSRLGWKLGSGKNAIVGCSQARSRPDFVPVSPSINESNLENNASFPWRG